MIQKIRSLLRGVKPTFRNLNMMDIMRKPRMMVNNPYYYTPRVQKHTCTAQFQKYCRFLQRKATVDSIDMRKFVQNMIAQYNFIYNRYLDNDENEAEGNKQQVLQQQAKALGKSQDSILKQNQVNQYKARRQKFGVISNYTIHATEYSNYHGQVDWLLYTDQLHFFPVMFFQKQLNKFAGVGMAYSNMITKNHLKHLYSDSQIANKNYAGYSLITNGQEWQLFKMDADLQTKKSVIFEARQTPTNKFRNIYSDPDMIATCLGLFQECLDIKERNIRLIALEKVYQYLDEQKYMSERDQGLTLATKIILKLQDKTRLK